MKKMISWQMTGVSEPLKKVESEVPKPGEGEVVVEVAGCGVCHTDLGFYYDGVRMKSPLPLTLGHEISGIVLLAGEGSEALIGKAVIIPAVMTCGECDVCKHGLGNICRAQNMPGNDIQGGFASHIVVPARGLCEVPGYEEPNKTIGASGVTLAEMSVIADALTTPYQAIVDSGLTAGDTAVFVGIGGIGGFGAQIAKALGAAVVAIDIDPARLEAIKPFVDLTLNAKDFATAKELRKAVSNFVKGHGRRPTEWKIFECSGTEDGQIAAFGLLTFGAHLQIVGYTIAKPAVRLSNLMAFHASMRGNWGCIPEYYPAVMDLVMSGKVKIAPFVETHPLDDINDVFARAHNHEFIRRPIMVPSQ